jgi:hypothetical protein
MSNTFVGVHLDWPGSMGSDHALIRTLATTEQDARPPKEAHTNRFDLDADSEARELWDLMLRQHAPLLLSPPATTAAIDEAVDTLTRAFQIASKTVLKRKGCNPARSAHWWNDECSAAAGALHTAVSQDNRSTARVHLGRVTQKAKRNWADDYITCTNVWEVAQWRHGRRMTRIPAIKLASGELSFDHGEMSDMLGAHFFAREREPIPHSLPGDPPPFLADPSPL